MVLDRFLSRVRRNWKSLAGVREQRPRQSLLVGPRKWNLDELEARILLSTLSIADASLVEGDAGQANMVFTVTLDEAAGGDVTVDFATADGTATTADSDYTATANTLTIPAGELTGTIAVPILGDLTFEQNETFTVTLSNEAGAALGVSEATGTILNDDAPPLSIDSVSAVEGQNAVFTVTLAGPTTQTVTVDYATATGTASGSDFTAASDTLTFAPGQTTQTISIATTDDALDEADETFTVTLSNPGNATIDTAVGTGTIQDNDPAPSLTIGDVTQAEGDAGQTAFVFTVSLSAASGQTVTVDYTTVLGTAAAGDLDALPADTLTFAPGQTEQQVTVNVLGDLTFEPDETFFVDLANPTNATIGTPEATGTILNDDAPPISIDDVSAVEGQNAVFTVTLAGPTTQTVTVDYTTATGTAAADRFTATSGTLTFAPFETTKTITVPTVDNDVVDGDQTFTVDLSNPSNGTIDTPQGTGTILDNDPTITIDNVSQAEGDAGDTAFVFTVSLSAASTQTITVDYATVLGTATGDDLDGLPSGTLTFDPGDTSKQVTVNVLGDLTFEPDETFLVALSNATHATVPNGTQGTGTILNDDAPALSIDNVSAVEGQNVVFTVTLAGPTTQTVTVDYATATGTASGSDFTAASNTLTFAPGETTKTITIATIDDSLDEADETFTVTLSNPGNATIDTAVGTGTIQDNDPAPTITVDDVALPEGNAGQTLFTFRVLLSAASGQTVTVDYTTVLGTAAAGDLDALPADTLTFAPGETEQDVTVIVLGDTTFESDETFFVDLANPTNATIGTPEATGTILNDDAPPISIDDVSAVEGQNAVFTVTLAGPTTQTVTVDYTTATGTAAADRFTATSGTLTFAPFETTKTITVPTVDNDVVDGDQTFTVDLSNPSNGTIDTPQGTGTILDNDPTITIDNVSQAEGDAGDTAFVFTVSLSAASTQTITVDYATILGTATGDDLDGLPSGTLTFDPGDTSKQVTVNVLGDLTAEPDETFFVALSNATHATVPNGTQGTGTILNDDAPAISIDSVSITEGDDAVFTVTLSSATTQTVTVDYGTATGTASGSDFTAVGGTLIFAPGETSKTITVPTIDDLLDEDTETFTVDLSNPANATIDVAQGTGSILDNDQAPSIAINDVSQAEGNSDQTAFVFTVTLSHPSSRVITVDYATSLGTATLDDLDSLPSGTLTFNPGDTSMQVTVNVLGDTTVEPNETFFVDLSNATDATIGTPEGTGTILNDDSPDISIDSVTVTEGQGVQFTITLSAPTTQTVTVDYATATGTASAADFTGASGTLTFAPGETTKTLTVPTIDDTIDEDTEAFTVNLTNPANAVLDVAQGTGTILDNDLPPTVNVTYVTMPEGNSGQTPFVFSVTLSHASSRTVTVDYETADGTATAGSDYLAAADTLTFAPGETEKLVTVEVLGDTTSEPNETFLLNLANASNATLTGSSQGLGTIVNDDLVKMQVRLVAKPSVILHDHDRGVNFGHAAFRDGSATRVFTITNTGTHNLHISKILVPAGFKLVKAPAKTVAPHKKTTFSIRMLTGTAGKRLGFARVVSDASTGTLSVRLAGIVAGRKNSPLGAAAAPVLTGSLAASDSPTASASLASLFATKPWRISSLF